MNDLTVVLTAGGLSALVLEGIKIIWRRWVLKNPDFDFSEKFYLVVIPVLNVLLQPVLGLLLNDSSMIPSDWIGFARLVVLTLLASLVSIVSYEGGIKPLKVYTRTLTTK